MANLTQSPIPSKAQKPYEPRGGALDLLYSKEKEVIFTGPAGTGKTRAVLEKLHILANKYPGCRLGIGRKTRKSMTQSVLVTMDQKVLLGTPRLHRGDQEYKYPNGSKIVIVGMNDPERIKSTEFDIFYINEATECTLNEYEMTLRSLRNGVVPYQQLIADANPDRPTHWLKQRMDNGTGKSILSKHEDNPLLFKATGEPTTFGKEYLLTLDKLSGVRYSRLRMGLWVAAEGLVYADFDPSEHVIDQFIPPKQWKRYISIDFGFRNAFVAQWWTVHPSGTAYLYKEIYASEQRVETLAHRINELSSHEHIEAIITDHDAEDRATLEYHIGHSSAECGLSTALGPPILLAQKEIERGIHMVQDRFSANKIRFMRDTVIEPDESLKNRGLPQSTLQEIEGYVWDDVETKRLGELRKEQPIKKNDHGMDAMRYIIVFLDDPKSKMYDKLFSGPQSVEDGADDYSALWAELVFNRK